MRLPQICFMLLRQNLCSRTSPALQRRVAGFKGPQPLEQEIENGGHMVEEQHLSCVSRLCGKHLLRQGADTLDKFIGQVFCYFARASFWNPKNAEGHTSSACHSKGTKRIRNRPASWIPNHFVQRLLQSSYCSNPWLRCQRRCRKARLLQRHAPG